MAKYLVKIVGLLLISLGWANFLYSQNEFQLQCQVETSAPFFMTDQLQQLYVVNEQNEVSKYTNNCQVQFTYNNNTLGIIGSLDVSNPLSPILYYPDFQVIILLDRTLSPSVEISLLEWDVAQVACVAASVDNKLWLYDEVAYVLKKVDQEGTVLLESNNLSLVLNQLPKPKQMIARGNYVYLNDPEQGILIFDQFGQYQKTLDFKGIESFQVQDDQLLLCRGEEVLVYHLRSFQTTQVQLPTLSSIKQVRLQKDLLYVLSEKGIHIYQF